MNTTVERGEGRRFNISPKKLIASGLVSVALMSAGCGGPSKEERNKKIEANENKTEQVLKDAFYPAMAKLGKKAARFAKKHKDAAIWYEITDGQQELAIFNENNKHTLDITMKKGVGRNSFRPGDVEAVIIDNTSTSVRIEKDADDKPCFTGVTGSSEYSSVLNDENTLSRFVSINKCTTWSVDMGVNDQTSPSVVADIIIKDMNSNFQQLKREVESD